MSGLERDRAVAISNAANQARQQGIGRALQFAGGALPNIGSIQGLEGSAQKGLQASADMFNTRDQQRMAAQQQANQGKSQMIGTGVGIAASLASMF